MENLQMRILLLCGFIGSLFLFCSDDETVSADAYITNGINEFNQENLSTATSHFNNALVLDSSKSTAYFYLGKIVLKENDIVLIPETSTTCLNLSVSMEISPFSLPGINFIAYNRIDSVFLERKRCYDALNIYLNFLKLLELKGVDNIVTSADFATDKALAELVVEILAIIDFDNDGKLNLENELTAFRMFYDGNTNACAPNGTNKSRI